MTGPQTGETVTSHGYTLVRLNGHPDADCRGYVYKHRLIAIERLGRLLLPEERVRFRDRNPRNLDPDNIEVYSPPDLTETVTCGCGCGAVFSRYDSSHRERRYLPGHNTERLTTKRRPRCESGGGLPAYVRDELTEAFGGRCAYGCGRPAAVWDHLIPWARGGSFRRAGNAVPACRPCNAHKNADADVYAWIARGWASNPEAWDALTTDAYVLGDLAEFLDAYPEAAR